MITPISITECENMNCRNCSYVKEIDPTTVCHIRKKFQEEYSKEHNITIPLVICNKAKICDQDRCKKIHGVPHEHTANCMILCPLMGGCDIIDQEYKAVVAIVEAARRIYDPERLKEIKFDHEFVKRCEQELKEAMKVKKDLDEASFVMGFVSGAKVAMEMSAEL